MKKLRLLIWTFLLTGFTFLAYSAQIDETEALRKAKIFYGQRNRTLLRSTPEFKLIHRGKDDISNLRTSNYTVYYYIFNIGDQQGFVIVSGEDATKSILAYSDEGSFEANRMPANLQNWLNYYRSEIQFVQENKLDKTATPILAITNPNVVNPLLGSMKWDQDYPFNLLCPVDQTSKEQTVTGCVATAMAQIMNYHHWPLTGKSSHSYESEKYGTLSADFSKTTYDWGNMLDVYSYYATGRQDTAVARLMYHIGVASDMNYNTAANQGSGTFDVTAAQALVNYFDYDKDIQNYPRAFYTYTDWKNLIKNELNAFRPVYYSGSSSEGGHAFVCDGYDSNDLFHINWGWGGLSNGYFELSSLEPTSAGIGGYTGGYSQDQSMIAGIQKPDSIDVENNQIGMYGKGLTSSVSSISSISKKTLDLTLGFANFGIGSFTGKLGVGLYSNGLFQKTVYTTNSTSITSFSGSANYSFPGISLSSLSSGTYQLICVYQPTGCTSWQPFKNNNSLKNYVTVTVSGGAATITKPGTIPSLVLNQFQQDETIYRNRTSDFQITVENKGVDFYSNMGVKIYSASNPAIYQYFQDIVFLAAGETKTFEFSGTMTCAPGDYYAVAVYDSTNNQSETTFKKMESLMVQPVPISLLSEPADEVLTLTDNIHLEEGAVLTRNKPFTLKASILNTGGYFNSEVKAFVFPILGGNSVAQLNAQTVDLETNQTELVQMTGELDLDPGNYLITLYYNNETWSRFLPENMNSIGFTLIEEGAGLKNESTTDILLFPNPVRDLLTIQTTETIEHICILDLLGRVVSNHEQLNIPVNHLKKGMYVLRLQTKSGTKTLKFTKE